MNNIIEITNQYHPLTDGQAEKLAVVAERLTAMNKVLNLTALKTDEEIAILHFYDSLTLLNTGLFQNRSIIDIGCGGGFPSLPLAVCSENCTVTANDSTAKKLHFVAETARQAGITNLAVLEGRAEELARSKWRESFDVAVARGVARLNVLCELCLPLVKKGGFFVAMKGSRGAEEHVEAKNAIKKLGGKMVDIIDVGIPLFDRRHTLVVMEKTESTLPDYPRQYARMIKNPL